MGASALRRALLDEIERRGEDGGGAAEGEYDGRESDHDASLFDRIEALLVTRPTRPRHALCLYTMGIEGFDIDFEADYFAKTLIISPSHPPMSRDSLIKHNRPVQRSIATIGC